VFDGASSAGHYRRASQVGSSATFTLTTDNGARVSWGAVRGPTGGNADVALDGVFLATVSLYAPTTTYETVGTYSLPSGRHTLRVTVRGDHNPASGGFDVTVDFFDQLPPIGGRGFSLQRAGEGLVGSMLQTTWSVGSAQSGYILGRLSDSGVVLLPQGGGPLPSSATSYTDVALLTDPMYCYLLLPVQGLPPAPIASSDALCTLIGIRSGNVPGGFAVRLNESNTATLSWSPFLFDPGVDYFLIALNANGLRSISVPRGTLSVTDDTGGLFTCYAVMATLNGAAYGNTDGLCGIPGQARF
jgi:hypothetical protein